MDMLLTFYFFYLNAVSVYRLIGRQVISSVSSLGFLANGFNASLILYPFVFIIANILNNFTTQIKEDGNVVTSSLWAGEDSYRRKRTP